MGPPGANITLGGILDPNDISGCESLLEAYFLQASLARQASQSLGGMILVMTWSLCSEGFKSCCLLCTVVLSYEATLIEMCPARALFVAD